MSRPQTKLWRVAGVLAMVLALAVLTPAWAAPPPLQGRVTVGAVAVPGASVTATAGDTPGGVAASQANAAQTAVTASDGTFSFANLAAGIWTLRVTMTGFKPATQTVTVPAAQPVQVALTIADNSGLPELKVRTAAATPPAAPGQGAVAVNGSVDNAAASVYAQSPAFGNARPSLYRLYNGGIALVLGNSALDARSYSLTGAATPKPAYNDVTGTINFGGPLVIPHLINANSAPNVFVQYTKAVNRNAVTTAALVPTVAERGGDLSAVGGPVLSAGQLSAPAQALIALYPLPNLSNSGGNGRFNYQAPVITSTHLDSLQTRLSRYSSWGSIT
ncbi:MAG TPA: carboxypeptidase-like regulatory domain-containing protein, partial [Terriglobales bacterium]